MEQSSMMKQNQHRDTLQPMLLSFGCSILDNELQIPLDRRQNILIYHIKKKKTQTFSLKKCLIGITMCEEEKNVPITAFTALPMTLRRILQRTNPTTKPILKKDRNLAKGE